MGAVRGSDGMDGVHTNMTNTRNTPAEVMEISYPLLVEEYGLLSDTDGPGKYRGGLGLYRKVKILDHDANITLSTERGEIKPWGLFGGRSGSNSACLLIDSQGDTEILPTKITTKVPSEYTIVYQTPGAGGYESPLLREPDKVLHDVLEGLVSVERAYSEYGVVIDLFDEKVDYERTEKLRNKLNR
jgi:N-methylhydantoinase B